MKLNVAEIAQNLTQPFHIYKEGIEAQILAFMSRQHSTETPKSRLHFYVDSKQNVKATGEAKAPEGNMIQVIVMEGVIGRRSDAWYGITGTKDLMQRLDEGNADPNVIAHMIIASSPGGSALPTREAALAVLESAKPVGVYVEELCASAMYFIASGAKFIYAGKSAFVGSIGTVWSTLDFVPMFEKFGAKNLVIYADESYDKDLGRTEALAGKPDKLKNALVNPFQELFHSHVKATRPNIKDEAMHGMMYLPEQSLEMGLIDKICSQQEAFADLFKIANTSSNNTKTVKTNSKMNMKLFSWLSFFGPTSAIKAGTTEEKTEQELEQELGQKIQGVQAALTQAQTKITGLEAELATAKDSLKAEQDAHTLAKQTLQTEKEAHQKTQAALEAADPTIRKGELNSHKTDNEQKQTNTENFEDLEAEYEAEARERNGLPPLKKEAK